MSIFDNIRLIVFDFDGVFTNNMVYISEDGKESVVCNRSDGLGLEMIRELGIDMLILSTEKNPVVKHRSKKLGLECHHGIDNKFNYLKNIAIHKNVPLSEIVYLGNDINDLECLINVGISVVVADAYKDVKDVAKIVLKRGGGQGAVRELCELIKNSIIKNER